ncbi:M56 family metallopeptidase [uncultured Holdemanella sp.]|uniref:M56 family metallopeptidase n=1 Tax=uncultured Holdemanella sp. TaxID=1763549 RepID=UPI0025F3412F|nr:M56 family metallopeptidase [uncultured Holdemanella sp.]
MTGYKGLSLSDNPFVSFVRCLANEIAHISIHHPFAKEELKIIKQSQIVGYRQAYPVYKSNLIYGPCVIGLHKTILLPETDYSESDLNSILAHESYHIKKNHNLIKGILNLICCMYWWFIPIYFFRRYIFLYLEMKTDDSIIQNLDEKESFAYMQTLIQIQKQRSQKSFTSYISSNGFILNYRIHYMMRGLHKKKTNAFILVSTVLICFLSTFINISGYYTNTELTENTFEITNSNAYIFENKNNPPSLLFYLDNQYILGGYTNLKEIQDEQKLPTYKDLGKTRNIQSITNTQNTVIKNSKQTTYRWKYKLEDGYVYRRLYNACKNTWVSDWMSA